MFDDEFYPTPDWLADKLIEPYVAAIKAGRITSVLDPSAGAGALLRAVERVAPHGFRYYAIEKDPALAASLSGANWASVRVLGSDFLTYKGGAQHFDLIVMNPPFSQAAKHVLRAWNILHGGELVCVLPTASWYKGSVGELVNNYGGTYEHIGSAFVEADHSSDVKVSIIRLHKKASSFFDFDSIDGESTPAPSVAEVDLSSQIALRDTFGNTVKHFDAACNALGELTCAYASAQFHLAALGVSMRSLKIDDTCGFETKSKVAYNSLVDEVQASAWHAIVTRTGVGDLFTERMHKDFAKFINSNSALAFNADNIAKLAETLVQSRSSIAEQCIGDVFERMCNYDPKNKVLGWKTNSHYKVNKRVILPWFIEFDKISNVFRLSYSRDYSALNDIDKALCHATGRNFATTYTLENTLQEAFRISPQPKFVESEFFKCRWFKKNTLHLEFRDHDVWEAFNVAAAKGRRWLGESL